MDLLLSIAEVIVIVVAITSSYIVGWHRGHAAGHKAGSFEAMSRGMRVAKPLVRMASSRRDDES